MTFKQRTVLSILCSIVVLFHLSNCDDFKQTKSRSGSYPDTFTVAFYNVENLFDLELNGSEYPEYRPGTHNWNRDIFQQKLHTIASVIAALDAEIITLCEIENKNVLYHLQKQLKTLGVNYPFGEVGDKPNTTAAHTAILSKFPLHATAYIPTTHRNNTAFRNILEIDIALDTSVLKLFICHWPSKAHKESYRMKVAEVLSKRIRKLPPRTDYVILGDLNADYDECATFRSNGFDDTQGKTGINHVLRTVKLSSGLFVDYRDERELIGTNEFAHYDLWLEIPESNRMSYSHRGAPTTPDHILLPSALYDSCGINYADNSFAVFTLNGNLLRDNTPIRWQMQHQGKTKVHEGRGYSDHLPIYARFTRSPFSPSVNTPIPPKVVSGQSGPGDFESGFEGWVACNRDLSVRRIGSESKNGSFCLELKGLSLKENTCAARAILPVHEFTEKTPKSISMELKGTGQLSFRARKPGGKWVYFNAPDFKPSRSASYHPVNFPAWNHITLPIAGISIESELEIEIRAGKKQPFSFLVDCIDMGQ